MANMRNKLEEQYFQELDNLKLLEPGSEEYERTLASASKLYSIMVDEDKTNTELGNMLDKEEKSDIDRYIKYSLEVAGIVLPMCFYSHWMRKGFEFERTGTYCSTTFRGLFNKFNPKKM